MFQLKVNLYFEFFRAYYIAQWVKFNIYFRFNAKDHIFYPDPENKIILVVSTSHGGGIKTSHYLKKIGLLSFLIYPGYKLTNIKHYRMIKEDIIKVISLYKITKLIIVFGSNDADKESCLLFPKNESTDKINNALIYGNNEHDTYSIEDPLNIIHMYPNYVRERLDALCSSFFRGVQKLVELCRPEDVSLVAPMGRYLKSVSSHIGYNRSAYYFRYRLYGQFRDPIQGVNVSLIDVFRENWENGTINLLPFHRFSEVDNVIYQELYYPKYGAVHYSHEVYDSLLRAILEYSSS